ncbi:sensor histidine kinase KdpD [Mucilaginibacter sp. UR6-11]|uniref:sensor histidine kinase n=1 Tax=Mucilaginibacter sp. UR6-11 TaxID=1435644 RepID=UPI001E5F8643|nr:HAMP domain-containing sensor histidine kinase [Mucilaginibacter sp. UR6-11]MCC8425505.1 HAMP domain-containing histidine kinase [Mucilaginibacter sp. UR6-11]
MKNKEFESKSVQDPNGRRNSILYRFRLLFYTGAAVSVVLVAIIGVISYASLNREQAGGIKLIVAAGTLSVLAIVAFLVYIVLNELNSRFQAYQQEHELNQLKSNFITLASHEFRTPLSSILLSTALVEKYANQQDLGKVAKHSVKIKQVVHNLENILEDFLALEKLDAGEISANCVPFDLPALCREIIAETRLLSKAGQQLSYEQTGSCTMVSLDRQLIRNAVNHLLFNAITYAGENARIRLITAISDGRLSICVKDNGLGIAEKDQEKLFTIFYRVNESGNIPGTGLGLAIVKRYVELMNGKLRFYSKPQEETCFEMMFPISGSA